MEPLQSTLRQLSIVHSSFHKIMPLLEEHPNISYYINGAPAVVTGTFPTQLFLQDPLWNLLNSKLTSAFITERGMFWLTWLFRTWGLRDSKCNNCWFLADGWVLWADLLKILRLICGAAKRSIVASLQFCSGLIIKTGIRPVPPSLLAVNLFLSSRQENKTYLATYLTTWWHASVFFFS